MSQIGLPFDWARQMRDAPFLPAEANRIARAHIDAWRSWPVPISVLSGPPRSGKSALARHFVDIAGGEVIDPADRHDEQALFHRWNVARDGGLPLLLVSELPPAQWQVALPDLRSRLAAVPHVRIEEPDDALVRALIETGLAQAGSAYAPDVPEWLARRVERSYAGVAALIERLNALSLASSRKISVPFVKEALHGCAFLAIGEEDLAPDAAPDQDGKSSDHV